MSSPQAEEGPGGQRTWTPIPDPTALTDAAIGRATSQFRRELDAIRELLAERIETEATAREHAVDSLSAVITGRVADLDRSLDRRMALIAEVPDQLRSEWGRDIQAAREVTLTRLAGMDSATELVAENMRAVPSLMEERLRGLREVISERIDAIDRASELLAADVARTPTVVQTAIANVREVYDERFKSVAQQFAERDVRTEQAATASASALAAALQAAKEAVFEQSQAAGRAAEKTELSFTKQIDQIGLRIDTVIKGYDDRLTELKERIDRGEGTTAGAQGVTGSPYEASQFQQSETAARGNASRAMMALGISAVVAIISIISIIIVVVKK